MQHCELPAALNTIVLFARLGVTRIVSSEHIMKVLVGGSEFDRCIYGELDEFDSSFERRTNLAEPVELDECDSFDMPIFEQQKRMQNLVYEKVHCKRI